MWIVETYVIEPTANSEHNPDFQPDFEDHVAKRFGPFATEEAAEDWTRIVGASPKMAGAHFRLLEVSPVASIIDSL